MTDQTKTVGTMGFAERLIRHFQKNGFRDVTEGVILHVKSRFGDYEKIRSEFSRASSMGVSVPLAQYFEIRFIECFSETRSEEEIRKHFHSDFEPELRRQFPELFFGKTNYLFDENAVGTKFDIAIRIGQNVDNVAKIVLLNDPDSSFVEYFERQNVTQSEEWETLCSDLKIAVGKLALLQI
ncbi:MAG: hypothetical protein QG650_305 [Patescibacteria group bacterium]|nr:hypothetical protein [Patescibacteria group bacterium]